MKKITAHMFELTSDTFYYDNNKSILLCESAKTGKNRWVKKLHAVHTINSIIEDTHHYYISCETDELSGQFLAVEKKDGSTQWFIPGRSHLSILFDGFLYCIFQDTNEHFYLIKVNCTDGSKIWHHEIEIDLAEYKFQKEKIILEYQSGKNEILSSRTGVKI